MNIKVSKEEYDEFLTDKNFGEDCINILTDGQKQEISVESFGEKMIALVRSYKKKKEKKK